MNKEQLQLRTKLQIDEINLKLHQIKTELAARDHKDISENAKTTLKQLENLGNVVNELYKKIATVEVTDQLQYSEAEKNIYNSITSFNDAYREAGSMFRIK
jgi:hypothetical protein